MLFQEFLIFHIARGYEIAKLGIEGAAAVGGLQGMPRREAVIGARRVDMVARGTVSYTHLDVYKRQDKNLNQTSKNLLFYELLHDL